MRSPIILVEILSIAVLFGGLQAGKTRNCCERLKNLESGLLTCNSNMKIVLQKKAGRQAGKPSRDIHCDARIKGIEDELQSCRQAEDKRSRDEHCNAEIQTYEKSLQSCRQEEETRGKKFCSDQAYAILQEAVASCTRRSTKLVEKTAAQRGQAADFNENPDWPWGRHIECEGHNEEFDPCASQCGEDSCGSDPSELRECILSCNPSCVCKKGYIRHEGQCISRAKCDLLIRENSPM